MAKIIEFISVDPELRKRTIDRVEILVNTEIENSESKSQEDIGILYILQEIASNDQVTNVVILRGTL